MAAPVTLKGYEVALSSTGDLNGLGTKISISSTCDITEISTKDSGKVKYKMPGITDYSLSFEGYNDPALSSIKAILSAMYSGTKISWVAFKQEIGADGLPTGTKSNIFSGEGYIANCDTDFGMHDDTTYKATLSGSGIITIN